MKTKTLISLLAALAFSSAAVAETEGFKISGDLATSIFSESGKGSNAGSAPVTGAISNSQDDFSIDMAEINLEKGMGNTNFVLGIGYGAIFNQINNVVDTITGAPKATLNLTNAYINHKFGDSGFSAKLGKFESFMGYETNNYMDNMNYTRSYAFNYTMPFYHTGLGLMYSHEMFDIGLYMVNSQINTDLDENQNKSFGVSASLKMVENLMVKLNYLSGKQGPPTTGAVIPGGDFADTNTLNINVGYTMNNFDVAVAYVNKKMETGPNTPSAEAEVQSIALYAGYKMDNWGLGARYEMVTDDDGVVSAAVGTAAADNSFNNITVSGWYDLDTNARLKLEVASQSSDKAVFKDDKGLPDDNAMTYGAAFMYRF